MMFNLSNSLSILRLPLAFLFLSQNNSLRVIAVVLAMFTDSIDGYIARRSKSASRFGAILDPAMDKFFVYFALVVLFLESRLDLWQVLAMISRDFFLLIFWFYLVAIGLIRNYEYQSIRWGKASTALQFVVLIGICTSITFPPSIFMIFVLFGLLAFVELFLRLRTSS
ncbi:MAG: CDP-alcohol phosphatidyltransferase family protein [Chlamydiae bacterium]|nr:CDP-alcohol phosphatidyltransferase family protein [Chlamydiota bacterium]